MKNYILCTAIIVFMIGCESKEQNAEKLTLQNRVDSLTTKMEESRDREIKMEEIGLLIDSIDINRKSLQLKLIEGNIYADYVKRLQEINLYVQKTESKLKALESSSNNSSKASASSIRRLKADLGKRSQEVLDLQLQVAKLSDTNKVLLAKVNSKDSILSIKDLVIKLKESDITALEKMVADTNTKNKEMVANLYFDQAEALEEAANRTQFASGKKRESRREALELYRLSLSLGNSKAQSRINFLEKKLS